MAGALEARQAARGISEARATYNELAVALSQAAAINRRMAAALRSVINHTEAGHRIEGPLLSEIKELTK